MKIKVFRVGIRPQLIGLVLLVTSSSLVILAIITGLYFSANYKSLRANRLEVIAQMKASQVQQNLYFQYYQVSWLTVRDTIQRPMTNYRAGNTSSANWYTAEATIQQFLSSSATFTNVRLYDSKFTQVVNSQANWSSNFVVDDVLEDLFPLDKDNVTLPSSLDTMGALTGPLINSSSPQTSYVMSMTLPIFTSGSILTDSTDLAGYLTAVMSAQGLTAIMKDATLTESGTSVILLKFADSEISEDHPENFSFVMESEHKPQQSSNTFSIDDSYLAEQVLRNQKTGSTSSTRSLDGSRMAAGYCPVDFNMTRWGAVVEQPRSTFLAPSNKLTKIIIGVVFGTAVFMAIITIPLAHWAVQPIMRLQKATETIVMGRGLQPPPDGEKRKDFGGPYLSSSRGSSNSGVHSPTTSHHIIGDRTSHENGSVSSGYMGNSGSHHYIGDARVPVYSRFFRDELSRLTDSFNVMTDELDRQYSMLEERVKARTKQLEAAKIQAEAANEAKTVFIANISHELRTPLNGILGMTAIAMAETEPNKIQQSLKLIFRSGELLLHILTELLTFSKNQLKRSKLEHSDFTATEVALQIKSIFGKLAKDQNVNLAIRLKPDDIRRKVLYGDSNRIIQIVMNLVSNSLKFTPVDGNVSVTIRVTGEYDAARSESENFRQVYTKADSPNEPDISEDEKCNKDQLLSSPNDTSSSDSMNEKLSGNDDDDNKSIVTVSTSSYDDNVFTKQFKPNQATLTGELNEQTIETKDLEEEKTWVFEFIVEDTGPGIDPKLHKSVFEPFVQGDQTLSRQYGGTGLGLSICTQLATMMNGVLELESTVGVGSKFTFRVPLLQRKELVVTDKDLEFYEDEFNMHSKKNRRVRILEPENGQATEKKEVNSDSNSKPSPFDDSHGNEYFSSTAAPPRMPLGDRKPSSVHSYNSQMTNTFAVDNLKILVAEDNNVNQEVIKRMLNLEGFSDIQLAVDGEEAVKLVSSEKEKNGKEYNIIFMDVQMPRVDGLQATTAIKKMGYKGPIVALTAFTDESNVKKCLDAGMNGFLSKPIRRSQLRQILMEFCPVILKEAVTSPGIDESHKQQKDSGNNGNNEDGNVKNASQNNEEKK